jgi:hypothetical protein
VARELAALRAAIEQEDFDQVPYAQHARRRRLARTRLLDPRSASPLSGTAMPCPISTGWTCVKRDTRRVRLVRSEGRGVSTWYEGEGGGCGMRRVLDPRSASSLSGTESARGLSAGRGGAAGARLPPARDGGGSRRRLRSARRWPAR